MARLGRLTVPGYAHHILQRGNNRQPIFGDAEDYEQMLSLLAEHAEREKVAIHAYVLMHNHLHLLATPATQKGLSVMMQAVGRRYVQYFNKRHQRSGTLWEGRFKATLLQAERHLLPCMAYIDLNPVRAGIVSRPLDYKWSSYGNYVGHHADKRVTPHALYWQLGNTPFAREVRYAELVGQGVTPRQQAELTDSLLKGWPLGEPAFVAGLQKQTERRVIRRRAGRPYSKDVIDLSPIKRS
jgi:putative transposase